MFENDANEITIEDIENFLNGNGGVTSAPNADDSAQENSPATQPNEGAKSPDVTETQAFAHRLREATSKARNEERESIAKAFGYANYADMQKAREQSMLREKGYDPEDVAPIVEQLVQQRIAEDPRLKQFEQDRMNTWAQKELAELKDLTGGKISKMEDIPENVIELWKTKGSLKGAYIELQGESLIREMQNGIAGEQSKGSTGHMTTPQGTPASSLNSNKRPLTKQERDVYRLFNPDVTEEQLSKMMKDK